MKKIEQEQWNGVLKVISRIQLNKTDNNKIWFSSFPYGNCSKHYPKPLTYAPWLRPGRITEENETEHTVLENVLGVRPQVDCTNSRHDPGMFLSTNISKLLVKTPRHSSWKSFLDLVLHWAVFCWLLEVKKFGSGKSEFLASVYIQWGVTAYPEGSDSHFRMYINSVR